MDVYIASFSCLDISLLSFINFFVSDITVVDCGRHTNL